MNAQQVALVQQSWEKVKPLGQAAGELFYSKLFEAAPGIRGLVMVVFALPSFPYVFKVIKDHFPAPKETTRALVKQLCYCFLAGTRY